MVISWDLNDDSLREFVPISTSIPEAAGKSHAASFTAIAWKDVCWRLLRMSKLPLVGGFLQRGLSVARFLQEVMMIDGTPNRLHFLYVKIFQMPLFSI